jgi:hypothetical protein
VFPAKTTATTARTATTATTMPTMGIDRDFPDDCGWLFVVPAMGLLSGVGE